MQPQYKIPLHQCQWCYKKTGRLIVDCLCIVCEPCYTQKKHWIDDKVKCFYCQKPTQRKFIDLKVNPQQGGMYFQNLSMSMKNVARIQQFQSQVSRKYCKHLEKKASKLEMVIGNFVKQFPQFEKYFESQLDQLQHKEYQKYRSKSTDLQFHSHQQQGKALFHNNTERNIGAIPKPIPRQVAQLDSIRKQDQYTSHNNQRNNNFPQSGQVNQPQPPKRSNNQYSVVSKHSKRSQMQEGYLELNNNKHSYQNQIKQQNHQGPQTFKNISQHPHYAQGNNSMNQPAQPQIQIYTIGGSKKYSDPTRHQMNLNNINMQTALRSIKSEDGKDGFMPFHQHNAIDSRQINNRNQVRKYRDDDEDSGDERKRRDNGFNGFNGFGRKKGAK